MIINWIAKSHTSVSNCRHVHEKDCVIQILSMALELNDEKYMSNAICRARNFAFKIAEVSYSQSLGE